MARRASLVLIGSLFCASGFGQVYTFTNFCGLPGHPAGSADGTGTVARFNSPYAAAIHSNGTLFVADTMNNLIRQVDPSGAVTSIAGDPWALGGDDGTNGTARFNQPAAIAVDASGTLYVADSANCTIRRLSPQGTNWVVETIAGLMGFAGSADGVGGVARFNSPSGLALGPAGQLYVADTFNATIRMMTRTGTVWTVSTIAGRASQFGSDDGTNTAARFSQPLGIAVDDAGILYTADAGNNTIRKITPVGTNWVVTTLAGIAGLPGSDDGPNGQSLFNMPYGVAADADGCVYVADAMNYTIRKITAGGLASTIGGLAWSAGTADGAGATARFSQPNGVTVDRSGVLYVVDTGNNRISRGLPSLAITTASPLPSGTVAVPYRLVLRAVGGTAPYAWSVVTGALPAGYGLESNGVIHGTCNVATNAALALRVTDATGLTASRTFALAVAMPATPVITSATVLPGGKAGRPYSHALSAMGGVVPYTWSVAVGALPSGLSLSTNGTISGVCGAVGNAAFTVRVTSSDGLSSTQSFTLSIVPPEPPSAVISGPITVTAYIPFTHTLAATAGEFPYSWSLVLGSLPAGLSLTSAGVLSGTPEAPPGSVSLSVSVTGSDGLASTGTVSLALVAPPPGYYFKTLAGLPGSAGTADGSGSGARFNHPGGVVAETNGTVYVADAMNNTIRRITPDGEVTTLAGDPGMPGWADGSNAVARFNSPTALALGPGGELYVADTGNCVIRQIRSSGSEWVVSTLAGLPGYAGSSDGTNDVARFNNPQGLACDQAGNLYVSDTLNNTIRRMAQAGSAWAVTTLVGKPGFGGSADGTNGAARFLMPAGAALGGNGALYVADTGNGVVRRVLQSGTNWVVTTLAGTPGLIGAQDGVGPEAQFSAPSGVAADADGNVFVTDPVAGTIRRIDVNGAVTTVGGLAFHTGANNGLGPAARFDQPAAVTVDWEGNLLVADTLNHRISRGLSLFPPSVSGSRLLPPGIVGAAYGQTLAARGGKPPFRWSLVAGRLPDGLGMDTNGVISGVPTARARAIFTVRVEGRDGLRGERHLDLTIVALPGSSTGLYTWVNLAGLPNGFGNADGPGPDARFGHPRSVAVAGNGQVYVADCFNHSIREISPSGTVSTLAGGAGAGGHTDGTGTVARFMYPQSVAVDQFGRIYVADGDHTIRRITTDGVVTTLAGSPNSMGYADGTGSDARFNGPKGLAADAAGNLYLADYGNHAIRKITPAGAVTTFAGIPGVSGHADGIGSAARFTYPSDVALDAAGNVYVADGSNYAVRRITPDGVVTTIAGAPGHVGAVDGTNGVARFRHLTGLSATGDGTLFVADYNNYAIRRVSPVGTNWVVTTVVALNYPDGIVCGEWARLGPFAPNDVALNAAGDLLVADYAGEAIRRITTHGVVSDFAGRALYWGYADGTGEEAVFWNPSGLALDGEGNLYVTDAAIPVIRKITPAGTVTTLAGSPRESGLADGTGTTARFESPQGIAATADGTLYVSDSYSNVIRVVSSAGVVTTLVQQPETTSDTVLPPVDGTNGVARLYYPHGLALGPDNHLYLADSGYRLIRKVSLTGQVTTLAGSFDHTEWESVDGTGTNASFHHPFAVAVDGATNVYVTDFADHVIRKVTPGGVVTTFAGRAGVAGHADGVGGEARFNRPRGIAADRDGNLYVTEFGHVVRKITPAGAVTTIGGSPDVVGGNDGEGPRAAFNSPGGVVVSPDGMVYVADEIERRITRGALLPSAVSGGSRTLQPCTPGTAYTHALEPPAGLITPLVWYVIDGTPPSGLGLSSSGVLSGTPTASAPSPFTVCAIGADGNAYTLLLNFLMNYAPPTLDMAWSQGRPQLKILGSQGAAFVVQISSNLVHWQDLSTGVVPSGDQAEVPDETAAGVRTRFYRVLLR